MSVYVIDNCGAVHRRRPSDYVDDDLDLERDRIVEIGFGRRLGECLSSRQEQQTETPSIPEDPDPPRVETCPDVWFRYLIYQCGTSKGCASQTQAVMYSVFYFPLATVMVIFGARGVCIEEINIVSTILLAVAWALLFLKLPFAVFQAGSDYLATRTPRYSTEDILRELEQRDLSRPSHRNIEAARRCVDFVNVRDDRCSCA
jgi:hypothetical protein